MAENENEGVSRRGFIGGTIAAAAGAGVLPLLPGLAPQVAAGEYVTWFGTAALHVVALREKYRATIARFAAELEPRFRSGELHANRTAEDEAYGERDIPWWETAQGKMERLAAEAFGVETTGEKGEEEGDAVMAFVILACSPHGEAVSLEYDHIAMDAAEAVAWDLLAEARRAGYYTPTDDETEDPLIGLKRCQACGHYVEHHDGAGCRAGGDWGGGDCTCTARHTPHVPGMVMA